MFYTCNYNIRVTQQKWSLLSMFLLNQIRERIINGCSLFILSLHALALHLAVKILLQIFLYEEDLSIIIHTSVNLYFPPECQQDRTLLRNQYY